MENTNPISAKEGMQELTMLLLYLSRFTEGKFSEGTDFYAW